MRASKSKKDTKYKYTLILDLTKRKVELKDINVTYLAI